MAEPPGQPPEPLLVPLPDLGAEQSASSLERRSTRAKRALVNYQEDSAQDQGTVAQEPLPKRTRAASSAQVRFGKSGRHLCASVIRLAPCLCKHY